MTSLFKKMILPVAMLVCTGVVAADVNLTDAAAKAVVEGATVDAAKAIADAAKATEKTTVGCTGGFKNTCGTVCGKIAAPFKYVGGKVSTVASKTGTFIQANKCAVAAGAVVTVAVAAACYYKFVYLANKEAAAKKAAMMKKIAQEKAKQAETATSNVA